MILRYGVASHNKLLQVSFNPLPIVAAPRMGSASIEPELRR